MKYKNKKKKEAYAVEIRKWQPVTSDNSNISGLEIKIELILKSRIVCYPKI
jgi:hypothetical protein